MSALAESMIILDCPSSEVAPAPPNSSEEGQSSNDIDVQHNNNRISRHLRHRANRIK